MTNLEPDSGSNRDDLLQRIELMESMIAEGRRFTARCGWIFVLWGFVALVAITWQFFWPHSHWAGFWAWPTCLITGVIFTILGKALQKNGRAQSKSMQCRSVESVWIMMGIALALYVTCAMVRHLTWQYCYIAGLLVIVGLAHAISASILRWRVQGVVAATWWLGAVAIFWVRTQSQVQAVMFVEMCLSMIAFGLYAMLLERRNDGQGSTHA